MRTVATLVALIGGANAQSTYTCGDDFNAGLCAVSGSPGLIEDGTTPCGCSNGDSDAIACADVQLCCQTPTCSSASFSDSACTGLWTPSDNTDDVECGWDGCTVDECCDPVTPTQCVEALCGSGLKLVTSSEAVDCGDECTPSDCCEPNVCEAPGDTLGASGYYASNPEGTTVDELGTLGCSTGPYDENTNTGGYLGMPYNVQVSCPDDNGSFQWSGCTPAADCDGSTNRVAAQAQCVAKGVPDSDGDDAQLPADVEQCQLAPEDLVDATACLAVVTDHTADDWTEGVCGNGPCRTHEAATCTIPADWTPTTCPPSACVFDGLDSNGEETTEGSASDCPAGCTYTPPSAQACDYTPAIPGDILVMSDLGPHVVDSTCAALDPDGVLKHMQTCLVTCEDGYHLEESKRDANKNRITNPKFWRPLQPMCEDGVLHYAVTCVEDTDWTGVIIIVSVLAFFLILIPVVKYLKVVGAYNQEKAAGCTWKGDGTKVTPEAASDEAAD